MLFFFAFIVFFLIFINALFIASEFALVRVRRSYVESLALKGDKPAIKVIAALDDLPTYLSATQMGSTAANIALGLVIEPVLQSWLGKTLILIIITYFQVVLGELVPKAIVLTKPEFFIFLIITPLSYYVKVTAPAISFLNKSSQFFLSFFGIKLKIKQVKTHSRDEIKLILNQSRKKGVLSAPELEMISNIFSLKDTAVKKIMIPKDKISALCVENSIKEIEKEIKTCRYPYNRFPVFKESINKIIGFIHITDFYKAIEKNAKNISFFKLNIIRPVLYVDENDKINEVLLIMRRKKIQVAVVSENKNKTIGLISQVDVFQALIKRNDIFLEN